MLILLFFDRAMITMITIGRNTLIGPSVQIYTPHHPVNLGSYNFIDKYQQLL